VPARFELALLLCTLPLVACKEPPSFRVRWSLQDREGDTRDVTRAIDCSSLGINAVQVTSIDGFGDVADERIFPCFLDRFEDLDGDVGGPALPDGPYAIEVRAVQRNGEPWRTGAPDPQIRDSDLEGEASYCHPAAKHVGCQDVDVACSCEVIDVSESVTPQLRPCIDKEVLDDGTIGDGIDDIDGVKCSRYLAALVAPAECVDGIDNDQDGLVDAQDPACTRGIPDAAEDSSVGVVQFRAVVTVFGNPELDAGAVGLTELRVRACTEQPPGVPCTAEDGTTVEGTIDLATLGLRENEPIFFDEQLQVGRYTVEVVGLDTAGEVRTRPELAPPVEVFDNVPGTFVDIEVDFGVDDFLTPVSAPAKFLIYYEQRPDDGSVRGCDPGVGDGTLTVADVSLELRDAHGGALPMPAPSADPVRPLDGTPGGCLVREIRTQPLDWGGYTLRVEAHAADGTVCFTTDGQGIAPDAPLTLFPNSAPVLVVPRVLVNGVPPESCRDCAVDELDSVDCNHNECRSGICQR